MPGRLTEIFNPTFAHAQDRLFVAVEENCTTVNNDGCFESLDISNGMPSSILNSFELGTGGSILSVSGFIVDNLSALDQASSIYLESLGGFGTPASAIKLTQSALQ